MDKIHSWYEDFQDVEGVCRVVSLEEIRENDFNLNIPNWVQGYVKYWENRSQEANDAGDLATAKSAAIHKKNAEEFGTHLRGITEEYQIAYIELDKDLAVDKVCDIFTQINSRGVRLDVFDLINALLKPKGLQLKHMWREAAPKLEFVETEKMNVYILQVMSILRQSYCSPKYLYYLIPGQHKQIREPDGSRKKEVLIADIQDFQKRWDASVLALENAIKLLQHPQEFGVVSSQYLPYVSILPVFSALQEQSSALAAHKKLNAQRKIRHWYWASVFTNRYSGSVESTSSRDFLDVKAWFEEDAPAPPLIQEFKMRFRNLELRKEVKRGTSVYNGVFNLLVLQGARDWMTGNIPQHVDLDDHHIVPASWGKSMNGNQINTILNRTPLSSQTNRHVIGDRLPNKYLPELISTNGESAVKAILESHFISSVALEILLRDPFTPEDFEDFISERQHTIQVAIENLLIKERLDLAPQIRELDEKIETVELTLRKIIAQILEEDITRLPPHIMNKAQDRVSKAAKKNAALDTDQFSNLSGLLEYTDLRELEAAILSKSTWPNFSLRFNNKETLSSKFNQLAELRNGIRHSRTVDEVARMEGEAAILWFQKVLEK